MNRYLLTVYISLCLLISSAGFAGEWQLDPERSRLTFTARQQLADFQGEFSTFTAQIEFDPAQAEAGRINAVIDLASVETQNTERDDYLVLPEWLDVPQWPASTYAADTIRAAGNGTSWIADGKLTLKGVTLPVELLFTFTEDSEGAELIGTANLNRMDFNVGTGGWTDTRWVGNPVTINVELRLLGSE
jgi:polyisoprenoid-binding protein YceI